MKAPRSFKLLVLSALSLLMLSTAHAQSQDVDTENTCVFNCPALAKASKLKPVCGSDGHPHPSLCMLEYESCLRPDKLHPEPVAPKNCAFFGALSFDEPRLVGILPVGIEPSNLGDDEGDDTGESSSDSSSSGSDDDDGSDSDDSQSIAVVVDDSLTNPTAAPTTSPPFGDTQDLGDLGFQTTKWLGDDDFGSSGSDSSSSGDDFGSIGSDSSSSGDDDDSDEGSARCEIMCMTRYDPVCASNGLTYGNRCELSVAKCLDPKLTEVHPGDCNRIIDIVYEFPQPSEPEPSPPPNHTGPYPLALQPTEKGYDPCAYVCPIFNAPVCSEDGHMYDNGCVFASAFCRDSMLQDATAEICKTV